MARVPECKRRSRKHLIKSNTTDARALQLETAKQILAEVFHARPSDVEDMIIIRLAEKFRPEEISRSEEKDRIKEQRSVGQWGPWPEMFQVES
jgi:hypothetical protein